MTEAEWLGADSPPGMLGWLLDGPPRRSWPGGRPRGGSDRKLRLFACACCRAVWHLLTEDRSRRAVDVAERYADGRAPESELWAAGQAAAGVRCRTGEAPAAAMWCAALRADMAARNMPGHPPAAAYMADLLRDVVGNPFSPAALNPALPNWCEVAGVAQAGYDERLPSGCLDPARLAVLADALEDAGCGEEALPRHLRSPGPHFRGCWALDLVLGKE